MEKFSKFIISMDSGEINNNPEVLENDATNNNPEVLENSETNNVAEVANDEEANEGLEVPDVPNSWEDPGTGATLSFNEEGMFVDSDGNKPQKGFKNDNKFGDWLHAYVQKRLLEKGLIISYVGGKGGAPIFHTPNAFNQPKKLLVLCCGAGRIHAGIWSVGVCAYHGLSNGSVLPCIEDAEKRGMEVVILNPNDNRSKIISSRYPKSFGMVAHALCAYEDFIIPGQPEHVYIICHSMGGECTLSAIEKWPEWSINHIEAVAMTDAVEYQIYAEGL